MPFGIVAFGYTDASGDVAFDVEPGSYQLVVSRGTEYSVYSAPLTITCGRHDQRDGADRARARHDRLRLVGLPRPRHPLGRLARGRRPPRRAVRRRGRRERHHDRPPRPHRPVADDRGARARQSGSPRRSARRSPPSTTATSTPTRSRSIRRGPSGGSTDWGQAAPPGQDFPSRGAFNATPGGDPRARDGRRAVDAATPRSRSTTSTSHFVPLQIDTAALVPPQRRPERRRAAPCGACRASRRPGTCSSTSRRSSCGTAPTAATRPSSWTSASGSG